MWEQPVLTPPEVTCAGWSGDRVEEAIESVCCEYEAKIQDRKAATADLDKAMVALYSSQPKGKNQAPIFNIQNSNIILGNVHQPGNLQIGQGGSIHYQPITDTKSQRYLGKILDIIGVIINFLKSVFLHK
jgi:hypothetical protein